MKQDFPYATHLDVKFDPLTLVDVPALVAACKDRWYNQTLCKVNESVMRLGVMQGEYHWHKHDDDDEFFFVLEGTFYVDLEGREIELKPWQGFTVPKGRGASHARATTRGDPDARERGHCADGRLTTPPTRASLR